MADNLRKVVILSRDMWGDISEWRWANKINTEADSLRNLIMAGLHFYKLMEDPEFQAAEAAALNRLNNNQN